MSDDYTWIEGIPLPPTWFSPDIIRELCDTFVVRDEDIYMVTYPKSEKACQSICPLHDVFVRKVKMLKKPKFELGKLMELHGEGTNWLMEIVCLIHSKGDPTWVKSLPVEERAPWIEIGEYSRTLKNKEDPRLITSHLPVQLFPKSFFCSKAKMIYLIRNPRDALVSGYFFWRSTNYIKKPESLEGFFKDFIHGNLPFGSWFEHTRGWLSLTDRDNILLLSYEELTKDARSVIKRICEFLGKTLEPRELDLVVKNSSFHVMKEIRNPEISTLTHKETHFSIMRKGIVGDWKNHFTVAQAEEFDKIFEEKMADFPKELFPWE